MKDVYIFVYGTLMRGYENQFAQTLHQNSEFIALGSTKGSLYKIAEYPGAIFDSQHLIHGEIFCFSNTDILSALDDYEGCYGFQNPNNYYNRIERLIDSNLGIIKCLTYEYAKSIANLPLIQSGRF